jgi:peptidoglycan/LPS O-acetylase OafA/YrhL
MDVLLYGVCAAFALHDESRRTRLAGWLGRKWVLGFLGVAFVAVVFTTNRWSGWFGNSLGYGASAAIMASLLAYLVACRPARLIRVLEWPPLAYVGKVSYGVYLFQSGAIDLLQDAVGIPTTSLGKLLFTAGAFALAILAATVSYRFLEAPILKLKGRFAPRRTPSLPSVAHDIRAT